MQADKRLENHEDPLRYVKKNDHEGRNQGRSEYVGVIAIVGAMIETAED